MNYNKMEDYFIIVENTWQVFSEENIRVGLEFKKEMESTFQDVYLTGKSVDFLLMDNPPHQLYFDPKSIPSSAKILGFFVAITGHMWSVVLDKNRSLLVVMNTGPADEESQKTIKAFGEFLTLHGIITQETSVQWLFDKALETVGSVYYPLHPFQCEVEMLNVPGYCHAWANIFVLQYIRTYAKPKNKLQLTLYTYRDFQSIESFYIVSLNTPPVERMKTFQYLWNQITKSLISVISISDIQQILQNETLRQTFIRFEKTCDFKFKLNSHILVAYRDDKVYGFMTIMQKSPDYAEIHDICTDKKRQRDIVMEFFRYLVYSPLYNSINTWAIQVGDKVELELYTSIFFCQWHIETDTGKFILWGNKNDTCTEQQRITNKNEITKIGQLFDKFPNRHLDLIKLAPEFAAINDIIEREYNTTLVSDIIIDQLLNPKFELNEKDQELANRFQNWFQNYRSVFPNVDLTIEMLQSLLVISRALV